jgi:hypothetical protein
MHCWDKGLFSRKFGQAWHGLADLADVATAGALIAAAERAGAWPVAIELAPTLARIATGADADLGRVLTGATYAAIGHYAAPHAPRIIGEGLSDRYAVVSPETWRRGVEAICDAGAEPDGGFSLSDGRVRVATFALPAADAGAAGSIESRIMLLDRCGGDGCFTVGSTAIRPVCMNTVRASLADSRSKLGKARHTGNMEIKAADLYARVIEETESLRATAGAMEVASRLRLDRDAAARVLSRLVPDAPEGATDRVKANVARDRAEILSAARRPENRIGGPGVDGANLGTLWNAATFLADRHADGSRRQLRGASLIESSILGGVGRRVETIHREIVTLIEVIQRDGTVVAVPAADAAAMGVPADQVGRAVIADLLGGEALS